VSSRSVRVKGRLGSGLASSGP